MYNRLTAICLQDTGINWKHNNGSNYFDITQLFNLEKSSILDIRRKQNEEIKI